MNREWLWGLVLFARAILFGAALGLYYEVFRFLRILFPHPAWLVAIEDLLFFLPASAAHLFFHFAYGEGETRWFGVLGVFLGFLLYLASAGRWMQKIQRRVKAYLLRALWEPLKKRRDGRREKRAAQKQAAKEKQKDKNDKKDKRKERNGKAA